MIKTSEKLTGITLFFLYNPEISFWQKSWVVMWLTSRVSTLTELILLLAIEHLTVIAS